MKIYFLIFCTFLVCHSIAKGQDLKQIYKANIPLHQDIVSGGYYVDPPKNLEGDPYFKSRNFENTNITINGIQYDSVPIMYSIYEDEVLTFQPVHFQKIIIRADKIDEFTLFLDEPHNFVRLQTNENYFYHRNGIYEIHVNGKAKLLEKHVKQIKSKNELSKFVGEFYARNDFFIVKGDEAHAIKKKKQAFDVLELNRKQTRALLRSKNLNFRTDRKKFLKLLTETYND